MNIETALYLINIISNLSHVFTALLLISFGLLIINCIGYLIYYCDNCDYRDWKEDPKIVKIVKAFKLRNIILIIIIVFTSLITIPIPRDTARSRIDNLLERRDQLKLEISKLQNHHNACVIF